MKYIEVTMIWAAALMVPAYIWQDDAGYGWPVVAFWGLATVVFVVVMIRMARAKTRR